MASCIPPGSIALAGLNLEQLRASPLYSKLQGVLAPFSSARSLLAAWGGKDLLIIMAGPFTGAPDGARLIAPGLAAAGPEEAVRAAEQQHQAGAPGAPELLTQADSLAAGNQIWIVVRGDVTLPLTGNSANVNRLLRGMEFAAATVRIESPIAFAITARGRTADAARHFEETLRATITMAAAADARHSDIAALLRSIQVRREDRVVRATLSADAGDAGKLLQLLTP